MMAPNEWACNRNSFGDSVVIPINPCTWSGITTHASNRTYDRTAGVRCHSRAATHPARDNPMMPFRTRPKNGRRSAVQIVTKYHAAVR